MFRFIDRKRNSPFNKSYLKNYHIILANRWTKRLGLPHTKKKLPISTSLSLTPVVIHEFVQLQQIKIIYKIYVETRETTGKHVKQVNVNKSYELVNNIQT